jgi:hypothetical protein
MKHQAKRGPLAQMDTIESHYGGERKVAWKIVKITAFIAYLS